MSLAKSYWQVPGPRGPAGADGSDGTNGVNGYTTTTAAFTMPIENSTVTVPVVSSVWAAIGMNVYIETAGMFQVVSRPSGTQLTLLNLRRTSLSEYLDNADATTVIASGKVVSGAGPQGPDGTDGSSGADEEGYYLVGRAANAPTNAHNLGLLTTGLLKMTVASNVATFTTAAAGTDFQSAHDNLDAFAGVTGAADRIFYFTGAGAGTLTTLSSFARTILDDTSEATVRATILAAARGANSDITSLAGLTTPLTKAQGGTGVASLPYFSANRGGVDQSGVATATATRLAFNTEVADSGAMYDTAAQRFTPTVAGAYAFTVAAQVNALVAVGDVVQVHLYKNGAVIATAKALATAAADDVQAVLHFVAEADGATDYFDAYVEHDAGVDKTVEGDEEVSFFCGHWIG
jgi:hypothetical protein